MGRGNKKLCGGWDHLFFHHNHITAEVGKLRPGGHMQPAEPFHVALDMKDHPIQNPNSYSHSKVLKWLPKARVLQ